MDLRGKAVYNNLPLNIKNIELNQIFAIPFYILKRFKTSCEYENVLKS